MSRFSQRLPPRTDINAISRVVDALRVGGTRFIDLTESNPTQVGLAYPLDLLDALANPRALVYEPHPRGLRAAREAVAAEGARRGAVIDPEHVLLSASTSEAYSWLFKLLCNPGDCVLVPRPGYPLFEHLTRLEAVRAIPYELNYRGRWEIDLDSLESAPEQTQAVVLVSPNNPTGSFVSAWELERIQALCANRGWALVADEVFADYVLETETPLRDVALRADVLAFTLGGASKAVGLPQLKLGWIVVGGPVRARDAAIDALELVADTFLSVGTPVQLAAPAVLERAVPVRAAIQRRIRRNLECARRVARDYVTCDVLRVEGGWSAVIRVPAVATEEQLVLALLERERLLVHPGYFFDFAHEAFLVVSLLLPEDVFADALPRVLSVG
jgi:alanine-synthesizing transaminase